MGKNEYSPEVWNKRELKMAEIALEDYDNDVIGIAKKGGAYGKRE